MSVMLNPKELILSICTFPIIYILMLVQQMQKAYIKVLAPPHLF